VTDFPRRDPLDIHVPVSSLTPAAPPGGQSLIVTLYLALGRELGKWFVEELSRPEIRRDRAR
jgi:hypothetical protein